MKYLPIITFMFLVLLFTAISYFSFVFIYPLCLSIISLAITIYFSISSLKKDDLLTAEVKELKNRIDNLQFSYKLNKQKASMLN